MYYNATSKTFFFCKNSSVGWQSMADLAPSSGGGGGTLKVYDGNDNELGYFLSALGQGAYVIANTSSGEVSAPVVRSGYSMTNTFFSGSNCTGAAKVSWSQYFTYCGYACTGFGTCTSNVACSPKNPSITHPFSASSLRRSSNGVCQNGSYNINNAVEVIPNPASACYMTQDCTVAP